MEASVQKESKRHKRRDEAGEQSVSEEGTKERKHRKKSHGKRKKKRPSVPNVDEQQSESSSTIGHDNIALEQDDTLIVAKSDRTNIVEAHEGVGAATSGEVSQNKVILVAEKDRDVIPTENTKGDGDDVIAREVTGSDRELRRRATLTEIAKSFDEDEMQDSNELMEPVREDSELTATTTRDEPINSPEEATDSEAVTSQADGNNTSTIEDPTKSDLPEGEETVSLLPDSESRDIPTQQGVSNAGFEGDTSATSGTVVDMSGNDMDTEEPLTDVVVVSGDTSTDVLPAQPESELTSESQLGHISNGTAEK